jgi:hypothetical protein
VGLYAFSYGWRLGLRKSVLLGREHLDQLAPPHKKRLEFPGRLVWQHSDFGPDPLTKERKYAGIDPIRLG